MNFSGIRFMSARTRPTRFTQRLPSTATPLKGLAALRWLRWIAAAIVLIVLGAETALGHDLFLRPVSFFVAPGTQIVIRVMNGTFSSSEAGVKRDRPRDLRVVGPSSTIRPDTISMEVGKAESLWRVATSAPGTYVVGMSLLPRTIHIEAKDFNEYLASDGIPSILKLRKQKGEMDSAASERYSKHVKALVQVGSSPTQRVDEVFGYPAEIVPLDNPYRSGPGKAIRIRLLVDGKPVPGQTVLMGGRGDSGKIYKERTLRSGADGIAILVPPVPGKWYAKFISMTPVRGNPADSVDYESKWATLTFAVK